MAVTYHDLFLKTKKAMTAAGIEAAQLESKELLCAAAGKSPETLLRDMRLYTTDEIEKRLDAMLERRLQGEPIAYLIGEWSFCGLPLYVSPAALRVSEPYPYFGPLCGNRLLGSDGGIYTEKYPRRVGGFFKRCLGSV